MRTSAHSNMIGRRGHLAATWREYYSIARAVRTLRTTAATSSPGSTDGEPVTPESLRLHYQQRRNKVYDQLVGKNTNYRAVFANNELSLKHTQVYGFDFDFTLIDYTEEVLKYIYESSRNRLVKGLSYPSGVGRLQYKPGFVIRGLHLDIRNGLLMKMDANHHIQLGSVYRGTVPVNSDDVVELYGGTHVPIYIMDDHHHRYGLEMQPKLLQFLDSFSLAEMSLLVDVSDYLASKQIPFDPEYLYLDIQRTVKEVHQSGDLHRAIMSDPDRYIENTPCTLKLLNLLKNAGKKLFILTNSPFWFVDQGMRHVTGAKDWRDLFDIVIVSARKPQFYNNTTRPFREMANTGQPTWQRVNFLKPGVVYMQGNITQFISLTKWKGDSVMYIGDHVYSDLADPTLHLGWKTCAVIPEMENEVNTANTVEFKQSLAKLLALETLLQTHQNYNDATIQAVVTEWKEERRKSRSELKRMYNPYFGSIFRTEKAPTYFNRRLSRFASLYMPSLESFLDYLPDHTFYPRRAALPHEVDLNFDLID